MIEQTRPLLAKVWGKEFARHTLGMKPQPGYRITRTLVVVFDVKKWGETEGQLEH